MKTFISGKYFLNKFIKLRIEKLAIDYSFNIVYKRLIRKCRMDDHKVPTRDVTNVSKV